MHAYIGNSTTCDAMESESESEKSTIPEQQVKLRFSLHSFDLFILQFKPQTATAEEKKTKICTNDHELSVFRSFMSFTRMCIHLCLYQ